MERDLALRDALQPVLSRLGAIHTKVQDTWHLAGADAMQKANSADPKKYLPELAKITHDGVTGKISFDNKGDIKGGNLTLFTYKDGKRDQIAVVQ